MRKLFMNSCHGSGRVSGAGLVVETDDGLCLGTTAFGELIWMIVLVSGSWIHL